MLEDYNYNQKYNCPSKSNSKCNKFSYLQYLIIHFNQIDNCLELIKEDIKNNNNDIEYLDHKNDLGYTALMLSMKSYSIELITLLIKKGCNINLQNDSGYTALMLICESMEDYLVDGGEYDTSIYLDFYIEIIQLLIDHNVNLNLKNNIGSHALNMVPFTTKKSFDILKLFVENGLDINIKDEDGNNLLIKAQFYREDETPDSLIIMEYLINKGIDVNHKNKDNSRVVDIFIRDNNRYCKIKLLMENGLMIDYNHMTYILLINQYEDDSDQLRNLFINNIDFNNIEEVKRIYDKIIEIHKIRDLQDLVLNNIFIDMIIYKIIINDKWNKLDLYYLLKSKEEYDTILKMNNRNKIKRVN